MNLPDVSPGPTPTKRSSAACVHCSDRKVRCDKVRPCSTCVRHGVPCIFPPPKPRVPRKRRKCVHIEEFEKLLKRYEAIHRDKSVELDQSEVFASSQYEHHVTSSRSEVPQTVRRLTPPDLAVSGLQTTIFKPRLLQGQGGTKLVHNSLWSRVAEEIHDAGDPLEEDSTDDTSEDKSSQDDFAYVLGCNAAVTTFSHPPPQLINQLWQIFLRNINPLTKVVHIPSLQCAIEKATNSIEHIPRGFEALMFAIYTTAVLSLTQDECKQKLGENRAILLPRYVAATKAALSRARFMSSTSLVVLQALVLHILSIRDDYEPRAVWSLTGAAMRVAEGMGMGLDGTLLGLPPFETEIRRRIWWLLRTHDFRAAELNGQPKFRNFELDDTTPKMPANVNDSDLYPAMSQAAVESVRPTEMIWCMVRSAMATFAAGQTAKIVKPRKVAFTCDEYVAMDDLERKDNFVKGIEDMLETKYLRFCDPAQPLQLMALVGGRTATNLVRFMAHHPRRWAYQDHVPESERHFVWGVVTQLLEQYNMMQSHQHLKRFAWHVPYFIQWHAVIHILDTLRADPFHSDAQRVWQLIDILFENNLEIFLSINRPIIAAVGNLCLKAFGCREAALRTAKRSLSHPPEYITKLREQRDAAKARREAVATRIQEQGRLNNQNISRMIDNDYALSDTKSRSAEAPTAVQLQQFNSFPGSIRTEDDAFWLTAAPNEGFPTDGAADMTSLYTDAILAQDYSLNVPNEDAMDWERWDTWFGHLDPLHPKIVPRPERRISVQSLISK
ncbi:uncharacterized protein A1O5_12623 [Cladophialophora psammophila CBS 110553]|uniref:Zn(2)-C6 fungal-type domain-containing protein n=1 Tax=Cladophialophora psammophila CBS 110553 TaxID=1182543 RepID=W9VVX2_9EURO|nr:uncharacterized protein A1O5_12623 [Cladophialophora psammophila CBS 110553]EXJ56356.1 hypothetical protein A1O5_12623 [Cladophialophora psammophila CBS 110553]